MNNDIVPELLTRIQQQFDSKMNQSKVLKIALQNLLDNKATYIDVNDFAIEIGNVLSKILSDEIDSKNLPDQKMYYNIANRILNPTLKNNYNLIVDYASDVQTNLNHNARLHLKAQKPEFNQDKVNNLVDKISDTNSFDNVRWLLDEPIINFSQSVVDDTIQVNAEFHSHAGLRPKITRRLLGDACDWCRDLAGTYDYADAPKDIYRRHERCRCTVDYDPGNGRIQNVWSKKWYKSQNDDKIKMREQLNQNVKNNNRTSDSKEYREYINVLGSKEMPLSLAAYQELKYNHTTDWIRLQDHFFVKSRIHKGVYGKEINSEMQAAHLFKTRVEGRSYFNDGVDTQELLTTYSGTGRVEIDRHGKRTNKEIIYLDHNIGVEGSTGNQVSGFKIHHAKKRTHLVPVRKE